MVGTASGGGKRSGRSAMWADGLLQAPSSSVNRWPNPNEPNQPNQRRWVADGVGAARCQSSLASRADDCLAPATWVSAFPAETSRWPARILPLADRHYSLSGPAAHRCCGPVGGRSDAPSGRANPDFTAERAENAEEEPSGWRAAQDQFPGVRTWPCSTFQSTPRPPRSPR